jgi:hypothetical protein
MRLEVSSFVIAYRASKLRLVDLAEKRCAYSHQYRETAHTGRCPTNTAPLRARPRAAEPGACSVSRARVLTGLRAGADVGR